MSFGARVRVRLCGRLEFDELAVGQQPPSREGGSWEVR